MPSPAPLVPGVRGRPLPPLETLPPDTKLRPGIARAFLPWSISEDAWRQRYTRHSVHAAPAHRDGKGQRYILAGELQQFIRDLPHAAKRFPAGPADFTEQIPSCPLADVPDHVMLGTRALGHYFDLQPSSIWRRIKFGMDFGLRWRRVGRTWRVPAGDVKIFGLTKRKRPVARARRPAPDPARSVAVMPGFVLSLDMKRPA